jgi:hypothetical protein
MGLLKKCWLKIDGHKSQIALGFYLFQDQIIPIWFPAGVPDTQEKMLSSIAVCLAAFGLGHAVSKAVKK